MGISDVFTASRVLNELRGALTSKALTEGKLRLEGATKQLNAVSKFLASHPHDSLDKPLAKLGGRIADITMQREVDAISRSAQNAKTPEEIISLRNQIIALRRRYALNGEGLKTIHTANKYLDMAEKLNAKNLIEFTHEIEGEKKKSLFSSELLSLFEDEERHDLALDLYGLGELLIGKKYLEFDVALQEFPPQIKECFEGEGQDPEKTLSLALNLAFFLVNGFTRSPEEMIDEVALMKEDLEYLSREGESETPFSPHSYNKNSRR